MMAKQKIEIEVDIPEGYEPTGEIRVPRLGEPFTPAMIDNGVLVRHAEKEDVETCCFGRGPYRRIILRNKEPLAIQACRMAAGYFDKNTPWFEIKKVCEQAIADFEKGGAK
jgi:hypothetical protein